MSILSAKCRWCGFEAHTTPPTICPYVKALEFDAAGNVTRVEFLTGADFGKKVPDDEPEPEYPRKGHR